MTLDFDVSSAELLHELHDVVQGLVTCLGELLGATLEVDTLLQLFQVFSLVERATLLVDTHAFEGVRALIEEVSHAVLVAVDRAASGVNGSTLRSICALVETVVHAILVSVSSATHRVNRHASLSIRALVNTIRYAVLVEVERTTGIVNIQAGLGIRALVQSIRHAILVGISRATGRINSYALLGVRALVSGIRNSVAVEVAFATFSVHLGTFAGIGTLVQSIGHAILVGVSRAAEGVNSEACSSVRALIKCVGNTVLVSISRATRFVNRETSRRIFTLVETVVDAVLVSILRATHIVGLHAFGSVRALVESIRYAILVEVRFATERINACATASIRALVKTIKNAILVGILRATEGINHSTGRSLFALVLGIRYAIGIAVGLYVLDIATKAPSKGCSHSNRRSRGVAVADVTLRTAVTDSLVLHILHFFVSIVAKVSQGTNGNIGTQSEVDVPRQVETETRSQEHRVVHRIATVGTVFDTHFAREFREDIQPVGRHHVQARAINQGIGTLVGIDKACMGVPQDRHTKCTEVQGENHRSGKVNFVRGIRVGVATVIVQVPGMTRTDAHVFITGREIDITLDSEAKETLGIAHETGLQPNVQVATASLPDIAFAIALQVGMIIVQRKSHTEVNEILQTNCSMDITRKSTCRTMERTFLITLVDHATTRLRP